MILIANEYLLHLQNRMKKIIALLVFGIFLLQPACGKIKKKNALPGPNDKVYSVEVALVTVQSVPDTLSLQGVWQPTQTLEIKSEFSGKVSGLSVQEGQTVSSGDTLLKIEDTKLPWILDRQRAELREAEARYELDQSKINAGASLDDTSEEVPEEPEDTHTPKQVAPEDGEVANEMPPEQEQKPRQEDSEEPSNTENGQNILRQTIRKTGQPVQNPEIAENRLAFDQAKIDRIRAEVALSEKMLANGVLTAPIEGFVKKIYVSNGSSAAVGDRLLEIITVDPIELALKIEKEQVNKMDKNMGVKITVPDISNKTLTGEIAFVGAELDNEKKLEVRVHTPNTGFMIKSGMEGRVELAMGNHSHDALFVPEGAVLDKKGKSFVYTVNGRLATKQKITLGIHSNGMVEVVEGLERNEKIVTKNLQDLTEDEIFIQVK